MCTAWKSNNGGTMLALMNEHREEVLNVTEANKSDVWELLQ
jgi:hypothetical protein